MHDPVVFFNRHEIQAVLVGNDPRQLVEVALRVQKVRHQATPASAYA
jgi:hypothetical protein